MASKNEYIKKSEEVLKKYKNRISKIEASLKNSTASEKKALIKKSKELEEKYKIAEDHLNELKDTAVEGFEKVKERSIELFDALKDVFADYTDMISLEQIKEDVIYAKDEVVQYGMDKASEIEERVRENPLAAIAIAAGAGFILGLLIRRS